MEKNMQNIKKLYYVFIMIPCIMLLVSAYDKGPIQAISRYFLYLTNWGIALMVLFFYLKLYFRHKTKWIKDLFTLLLCLQTVITIFYWTFIHSIEEHYTNLFIFEIFMDHLYPMVFMLVEFFLNDFTPTNDQCMKLILFTVAYMSVNFWFTILSGTPIYGIINWRDLRSYCITIGAVSIMFLSFLFWKKVSVLKNRWKGKLKSLESKRAN